MMDCLLVMCSQTCIAAKLRAESGGKPAQVMASGREQVTALFLPCSIMLQLLLWKQLPLCTDTGFLE